MGQAKINQWVGALEEIKFKISLRVSYFISGTFFAKGLEIEAQHVLGVFRGPNW